MRFYEIIAAEAANKAGLIKPQKPLIIAQLQRRQEKNLKTQKRIRDEQAKSAEKVSKLRGDLE
jgi:folylpolyglutamate synthase/dihydropteroate synthase